jgi:hypothetical protein
MWYRGDVPREVLSPGGPPGRLVQSFPGNFYSWLCCPRWTSIFSHNSTLVVNSSDYKPRLPLRIASRHIHKRLAIKMGGQEEGDGEEHGLDLFPSTKDTRKEKKTTHRQGK